MLPNQGLNNDFDRLQRGSPSPVSSDIMPNYRGTGFSNRHAFSHDVSVGYPIVSNLASIVCAANVPILTLIYR